MIEFDAAVHTVPTSPPAAVANPVPEGDGETGGAPPGVEPGAPPVVLLDPPLEVVQAELKACILHVVALTGSFPTFAAAGGTADDGMGVEGVNLSPGSMTVDDPEVTAVVERVSQSLAEFYKAPAALSLPFQELAPLVNGEVAAEVHDVLKMDMTGESTAPGIDTLNAILAKLDGLQRTIDR